MFGTAESMYATLYKLYKPDEIYPIKTNTTAPRDVDLEAATKQMQLWCSRSAKRSEHEQLLAATSSMQNL